MRHGKGTDFWKFQQNLFAQACASPFHSVHVEVLNIVEVSPFSADEALKHGMRLGTGVRIFSSAKM